MTGYNDHDPVLPSLELCQEELELLMLSLADVLTRCGRRKDKPGLYPAIPEMSSVGAYSYPLPKELIKCLFYPKDDDVIVTDEAKAFYIAPHRIEPSSDETVSEILEVTTAVQLVGTDIQVHRMLYIVRENDIYDAYVEEEYLEHNRWINPHSSKPAMSNSIDESAVAGMDTERYMLGNPLTLHDAEKLRQIATFIGGAS